MSMASKMVGLALVVAQFLVPCGPALAVTQPPAIVQQPHSRAVTASEDVEFLVLASGAEPLSYQWRFNGENLAGETRSNLWVNYAEGYEAGDYVVVVTNSFGAVTSQVATLTVAYPRVLVQPASAVVTVAEGGVGGEVVFSVAPLPSEPLGYEWRFNGAPIPSGTGSNSVIPVVRTNHAGSYSVFVRTAFGGVGSEPLRLTVRSVKAVREEWAAPLAATGQPCGIVVDDSGCIYVAGSTSGGAGSCYLVAKYSQAAALLWQARSDDDVHIAGTAVGMAVDRAGNVYVTGTAAVNQSGTEQGFATVKYDANGTQCWARIYTGPGSSPVGHSDLAAGLALDDAGNVYVTGASTGTNTVRPYDYATVKYSPNGEMVWVQRFDTGGHDAAHAIAVDRETNVIVTGISGTVKYSRDGTELWRNSTTGVKLAVDREGNVFTLDVPRSGGEPFWPINQYCIRKMDPSGRDLWGNGGSAYRVSLTGMGLTLDRQGNAIVLADIVYSEWSNADVHVAKYAAADGKEWNAEFNGNGGGTAWADGGSVAVDAEGNVYVALTDDPWASGNCVPTVAKWDSRGNRVWTARRPRGWQHAWLVAVDKDFNVFAVEDGFTLVKWEQKPRLHPLGFLRSGDFHLCLTGEPRTNWSLQTTTNLTDWFTVGPLEFSVGTAGFFDAQAPDAAYRFYRATQTAP